MVHFKLTCCDRLILSITFIGGFQLCLCVCSICYYDLHIVPLTTFCLDIKKREERASIMHTVIGRVCAELENCH